MPMYEELMERLRNCATEAAPCKTCDMVEDSACSDTLMKQAADAIEELNCRIDRAIDLYNRNVEKSAMNEERDEWIRIGAELAAMHGSDATSQDLEEAFWTGYEEAMKKHDVRPVVLCKDCKHRPAKKDGRIKAPEDADGYTDYECPFVCEDSWYNRMPADDDYCSRGEKRKES